MEKTQSLKSTAYLVRLAALTAILVLMSFTPLGYLRVGTVSITFNVLPVAVGALVLGPAAGAFLGFVFGVTSFAQCFMGDPFGAALLAINPIWTGVMCIIPRALEGLLSGLLFKALKGGNANAPLFAYPVAALSTALFNTLFFVGGLLLFFWNTDFIQGVAATFGSSSVAGFVIILVGINGAIEWVVCAVAGGAIARVLRINSRTSTI
jgi:uncharacterized membrane protein